MKSFNKKEKKTLCEREEKFRLMTENSIDCIWTLDINLRFTYLSPSLEKIMGVKPEQWIGTKLSSHFKKNEFLKISALTAKAIKNYKTFSSVVFETKMLNDKNNEIDIEISSKTLLNSRGKLIGLQGVTRDITERKKAKEVLENNITKLQLLYDSSSDAIMLLDEDSFIDCNEATLKLFKCITKEEFCSKHPADLSPPTQPDGTSSVDYSKRNIEDALRDGSKRFEHLHRRLDGTDFPAEVLLDALVLNGKKMIQARVYDITDRKQIERALIEANTIINRSMMVAFLWKNEKNWPTEFVSENVERLTGYSSQEFIKEKILYNEIIYEDDLKKVEKEVVSFSKKEGVQEFVHEPYRIVTKKGDIKWINDKTYIRRDSQGIITHYEGIIYDITKKVLADQKLKDSEERFKVIFDSALDAMYLTDKKGNFVDGNKAAEDLVGYSKNELIGKSFLTLDLIVKDQIPIAAAGLAKNIAGHTIGPDLYRIKRKNGAIRQIETRTVPINIGGKKLFLGIGKDVTEKIKAVKLAEESQNKLHNIIKHISEMFYVHDRNNLLTYVSPQCNQLLGYTPDEMMRKWTELVTDNPINKKGREITQKALNTGEKQAPYLLEFMKKDGQKIWMEVDESPMKNERGKVVGVVGSVRDVTVKKFAEERIKKERDNTQKYLDLAGVMFVNLDDQGRVIMINKKGLKVLGYEDQNLVGKDWFELAIPQESRDKVRGVFNQMIKGDIRMVECHENEVVTSKNEKRIIAWHNTMLKNDKEEVISIFSSGEDVTERKKINESIKVRTIELEKVNELMIGRELKMAELKKKLAKHEGQISNEASIEVEELERELGEEIERKIQINDAKGIVDEKKERELSTDDSNNNEYLKQQLTKAENSNESK